MATGLRSATESAPAHIHTADPVKARLRHHHRNPHRGRSLLAFAPAPTPARMAGRPAQGCVLLRRHACSNSSSSGIREDARVRNSRQSFEPATIQPSPGQRHARREEQHPSHASHPPRIPPRQRHDSCACATAVARTCSSPFCCRSNPARAIHPTTHAHAHPHTESSPRHSPFH